MFDRFEILYSRIRRSLSRDRWSASILGHKTGAAQVDDPGLLLVEIGGLSEETLLFALRSGYMPFLRHLLEKDGHELWPLYSGLPSTASGFQAELLYGVRTAFPAARFRSREDGRTYAVSAPPTARAMEERLAEGRDPLLKGGSSWANLFAGGAMEAHLGAARTGLAPPLRDLAPRRALRLLPWHFANILRVCFGVAETTGLVLLDRFRGDITWRQVIDSLQLVPSLVAVNALLRELVTAGASVDAERGLPVIHLSYVGYDEVAHRRGPRARFALWSLRDIDRSLARVWRSAHRSRLRDYQIWIFSDHGIEASSPYREVAGSTLSEALARALARVAPESTEETAPPGVHTEFFPTALRLRWLGWKRRGPQGEEAGAAPKKKDGLELVLQGSVAFVYLDGHREDGLPGDLSRTLVHDEQVPAVLRREGEHALVDTAQGSFRLPEDASRWLGADHPHLEGVTEDLLRTLRHPDAGDLLLLGWRPTRSVSFQAERGVHGGPGPGETGGFLVLPPEASPLVPSTPPLRPATLREMSHRALDPAAFPLRSGSSADRAPVPRRGLRLMTYNVHGCRGMDGKVAPHRIARVIAREDPDIVCLQELDVERLRSGGVDQARAIAERLEVDYHFHAVAELGDGGRFGNAILSRHPLQLVETRALPAAPRAKGVLNLEDRGALLVAVEVNGTRVRIVNTHLSILASERRHQARALLADDFLGDPGLEGPMLLAGDLNAAPRSWTVRQLETRLRNAVPRDDRGLRTWTGRTPLRRIDHVLVSEDIEVQYVYVPRTELSRVASDHLPLVVDFVVRDRPEGT